MRFHSVTKEAKRESMERNAYTCPSGEHVGQCPRGNADKISLSLFPCLSLFGGVLTGLDGMRSGGVRWEKIDKWK